MKKLISFLKKQRISQILAVLLAGFALLLTPACSSGNVQGARPDNPPVQAGGENNPYKAGGDKYTDYQMSTEAEEDTKAVKSQPGQANLQINPSQLIAMKVNGSAADWSYPSAASVF